MTEIPDKTDFQRLESEVAEMSRLLHELHDAICAGDFVTVQDIANYEGIALETLYRKPWLMPDNGVSPSGARNRKWRRGDWGAWRDIPVEIREARYWNEKKAG